MTYGNIYVAQISLGTDDAQALKAFREAESYPGPSLVIAYSHCILHGIPRMKFGFEQQKKAVASGAWMLYRYDPRLVNEGKNPLQLDYRPHKREDTPPGDIAEYMYNEVRFKTLLRSKPERALPCCWNWRSKTRRIAGPTTSSWPQMDYSGAAAD